MRLLIFLFLLAGTLSAEEMVLISWHPNTRKIAVTAFPWKSWRKKHLAKTDDEIWSMKYPQCVPESLQGWRHVPSRRGAAGALLPADKKKRDRWRWNAASGRVLEDMSLPEPRNEALERLQAVIVSTSATRAQKLDALLEREAL